MVNKQHDSKRQILSWVCYRQFIANTRTQQHCAEMRAVQPINRGGAKRHYHNVALQTNEQIYCTPTNTHWAQAVQQATSKPRPSPGCLKPLSPVARLSNKLRRHTWLAPLNPSSPSLAKCPALLPFDSHCRPCHPNM